VASITYSLRGRWKRCALRNGKHVSVRSVKLGKNESMSQIPGESEMEKRLREAAPKVSKVIERMAAEAAKHLEAHKDTIESFTKRQKEIEEQRKKFMEPYAWQRDIMVQRQPKTFDEQNHASEFQKRLVEWIKEFDETLDEEHEVGARLVNFGESISFHIQSIGYWNPSLIVFNGLTKNNEPVELIQHVSQISILLMKLPKIDPNKPKHRFGFSKEDNGNSNN
jgi:hypothetical protein